MASNRLPGCRSSLKSSCSSMVEGCEALQNSIGLMRSSDSVLGGALSNFELKESEAVAARVKRMFS
jgi:hypothetical protein